VGYHER
jgi:hypothetical protein